MADHLINIHANGIGDHVPTARGHTQDTVQWQATQNPNGTYPQWFIYFQDPFANSVIATNAIQARARKSPYTKPTPCPGHIVLTGPRKLTQGFYVKKEIFVD